MPALSLTSFSSIPPLDNIVLLEAIFSLSHVNFGRYPQISSYNSLLDSHIQWMALLK